MIGKDQNYTSRKWQISNKWQTNNPEDQLMAWTHGISDYVQRVHDDEEVDDERDEAGDESSHDVAAVVMHLLADRQPPGVRVAVPPDLRYRAGGRHGSGEHHPQ